MNKKSSLTKYSVLAEFKDVFPEEIPECHLRESSILLLACPVD